MMVTGSGTFGMEAMARQFATVVFAPHVETASAMMLPDETTCAPSPTQCTR